jgi:HK97 family phage major capsid protein
MKDVQSDVGSAGGYLIPEAFHNELLQIAAESSAIISRVNRQPVGTDAGRFPSLDYTTAPTAGSGQTAMGSGLTGVMTAPGATYTEDQPTFKELNYTIRKYGGYVEVYNEVVADSPFAIENLLRNLFQIVVNSKLERDIIRGTGAGEPLGILNASVAVGITPATDNATAWADVLNMKARFKNLTGGQPVWIIHPGVWPDIGVFESSGGGGVWQANQAAALNSTIMGWPIVESEHSPQDDNAGNTILADMGSYLLFDRAQLSIAFSEHAAFTSDKGTWRFNARFDGQPWLSSAITLADPQGSYTVSPFVYHND